MYPGVAGHSYAFAAVARDNVNNAIDPPAQIAAPATAQALTAIPTPTPPRVSAVLVNGGGTGANGWSNSFRNNLAATGLGVGGYQIPLGANQEKTLPWTKINEIQIVFNEDVAVDQSDLVVTGVKVPNYAINGFKYDPATFKATWTLTNPIAVADRITVRLDGHGAAAVTDRLNLTLDGEFTNSLSTISGNGAAGGDFVFKINVVPGDADTNGGVNFTDYLKTRSSLNNVAGKSGYVVARDIDGNGGINFTDVLLARARIGNQLPKIPTPGSVPDESLADALFGALGSDPVASVPAAASLPNAARLEAITGDNVTLPTAAASAISWVANSSAGNSGAASKLAPQDSDPSPATESPAPSLSAQVSQPQPLSLSSAPIQSQGAIKQALNHAVAAREVAATANWLAAQRVELAWAASVDRVLTEQGASLAATWRSDETGSVIGGTVNGKLLRRR